MTDSLQVKCLPSRSSLKVPVKFKPSKKKKRKKFKDFHFLLRF